MKKAGKIGAALLVIGGLFYGIKKLFGGKDDEKSKVNTPVADNKQPAKPKEDSKADASSDKKPVATPPETGKDDKKADGKKEPGKVVPAPVADDENKEDKVDKKDNAEKTDKSEEAKKRNDRTLPQNYTVKKGDNVWNIAKRRLQEMNGKKPTDKEIMDYTNELLKLNKLEYEPDNYTVVIHEGDNIAYSA